MQILVVSDMHGRLESLQKILRLIHNRDVGLAVVLGDLTNYGGVKEAEEVLEELEGLEVLAIPGNLDTPEVLKTLEKKRISLHGKKKKVGKYTFAGFGGGLLGNPGSFLSSEEEIKNALNSLLKERGKTVLLTHLPPIDTKIDLSSIGTHIGSQAVREIIKERQPLLHLCGHAHGAFGEVKIGKTLSVNAGAVKEGRALLLHLEEEPRWERIQV